MERPSATVWTDLIALAKSQLEGGEFSFKMAAAVLRQRWLVVAACTALGLGVAVLLCTLTPPRYEAEALLEVTARQEQMVGLRDVVSNAYATGAALHSEVDVLTSAPMAARVVKFLDLQHSPAFMPAPGTGSRVLEALRLFVMPLRAIAQVEPREEREARLLATAVEKLQAHLKVRLRSQSYTLEITYSDANPHLAAAVANALVKAYLDSQLEERFAAAQRAGQWVDRRLDALRRQVQAADLAVETFREAHGLEKARGILLSEQQLGDLNSQLIVARTQLAEAQAKQQTARNHSGSTSAVLNNTLIQNLRLQEAEVRQHLSELATRYGPRHPKMQSVRNKLRDVERKIREESGNINSSLGNDVATAQARVDALEAQLDSLQGEANGSNDAAVKLAELERQAQAERSLYETFLARSKEIAQLDFAQADARPIATATAPLAPINTRQKKYIALGTCLGLMLGLLIVVVLESLDMTFRNGQQLQSYVGVRVLGLLGELPRDHAHPDYVLKHPATAFSESLRGMRTALQYSNPDKSLKSLLVTSSLPREGKSFFALELAQIAAQAGQKVLLVDADLRNPTLATSLGLKHKAGLAEVLVQKAKEQDVVVRLSKTLSLMPALANPVFSQELLNSTRMKTLLAEWQEAYDLIVVDAPPMVATADVLELSQAVDAVLFMVRWGSVPRPTALNCIEQLQAVYAPLVGCVMTRVDVERHNRYGYGDIGYSAAMGHAPLMPADAS